MANSSEGAPGKQRRCSLVLYETKQLLSGLQEDSLRSNALMAELETLLAASQVASSSDRSSVPNHETTLSSANFKATRQLEVPDEDDDIYDANGSGDADVPTRQLKTLNIVRRTSSVVSRETSVLYSHLIADGVDASTGSPFSSAAGTAAVRASSLTFCPRSHSCSNPRPNSDFFRNSPSSTAAHDDAVSLMIVGCKPALLQATGLPERRSLSMDVQTRGALSRRSSLTSGSVRTPSPSTGQLASASQFSIRSITVSGDGSGGAAARGDKVASGVHSVKPPLKAPAK